MDKREITLEMKIGKKSPKKSIRLAKINPLAFKDIIKVGREKLKKLNLVDNRLAEKERKKREQMLAVEHLESITGIANDDDDEMTTRRFAKFGF